MKPIKSLELLIDQVIENEVDVWLEQRHPIVKCLNEEPDWDDDQI